MAETLNLNKYKASGVYTVEIDQSQNISLPLSTGRLVIGSSKKGPINSVVLINDVRSLEAVYGTLDSKLEKNGSYFHRTVQVALRQGPVYAINLLPIQDTDVAYFGTFNTESASNNETWTSSIYKDSISHFYNTQKLWFVDADEVSKYKNLKLGDSYPASGTITKASNKILTLVNLNKTAVTAWVRQADTTGYNISVKDYYKLLGNNAEIPAFLNQDDTMADYFVEIIVVQGDWTNHLKLAKDPIYKQFFAETGLINSKLDSFLSLREVSVLNRTIGSLIPDFLDLSGNVASVDTLFNRYFSQSGLFCSLDQNKIDKIDLTNNTFDSGVTELMAEQRLDLVGYGFDELSYTVDDGNIDDGTAAIKLIDTLSYKKSAGYNYNFVLDHVAYLGSFSNGETYTVNPGNGNPTYIVATEGSKLYTAWKNGFIKTSDKVHWIQSGNIPTTQYMLTDGLVKKSGAVNYIVFETFSDIDFLNPVDTGYITSLGGQKILNIISAKADQFNFDFDLNSSDFFITTGPGTYTYEAPNKLTFTLNPALYGNPAKKETPNFGIPFQPTNRGLVDSFFKAGQYIKAEVELDGNGDTVIRPRLLRIKSVSAQATYLSYLAVQVKTLTYTVVVDAPTDKDIIGIDLTDGMVKAYKGIKNYVTNLNGLSLPGISIDENGLYPNGTAGRQNTILDYMFTNTNIASTIADKETLDFRYIIDSYEGQIAPGSKQQLAQLAANHGQALAIVNAPSFAQYTNSIDPGFIDINTELVSTQYIAEGGNLSSNPSFTFGFATGAKEGIPVSSYVAYWMPNLMVYEGGKMKSIPPAAYVGNVYMNKYSSGNTFLIAAGKRGIIGDAEVSGLEYDLTDDDRANLEPVGFNLIVRRRGFGVMLLSNNTGYQTVKSALNNIHVREALITIERDVNRILFNFLFDFNDPTTRLRVKTLVKNYLNAVQDANGISTFDLIFDDSNNGQTVLENNAGIIDISLDFPRGIQKFINRITITRVGGQFSSSSTGFTPSF